MSPAKDTTEHGPEWDAPIPTKNLAIPATPKTIISDAIRDRIKKGVYEPRTTLPSLERMEKMTGAARGTIRAALKILAGEGYVRSVIGLGAFVLDEKFWGHPELLEQ
jgi:DNA-binding GntR family transcriptional regulator